MNTKLKILLAVLGIVFVGVVIWAVTTTPDAPQSTDKIESPTLMEYVGNTISEEVDGVKVWELTAGRAFVDIPTQNAALQDIVGHFYQKDGRTIELRANFGFYDNTTKNVHVEGDVKVFTDDGAELNCVKLDWLNTEYKLTASEKVKIIKDDIKATGDMAESNDGFRNFKLKGHVHIVKGDEQQGQNEKNKKTHNT